MIIQYNIISNEIYNFENKEFYNKISQEIDKFYQNNIDFLNIKLTVI